LTFRRCAGGYYHLFVIFAVLDVSLAVNSCINCSFFYIYHRLRGSASTVLTANGQVNGTWRILAPHRIETHDPIAIKFRTIDYFRERTH